MVQNFFVVFDFNNFHSLIIFFFTLSNFLVIFSINQVHSIFFVGVASILASFILLIFENEFIGLLLIAIYVGAVIVVFLFVIMMLNLKLIKINWILFFFILQLLVSFTIYSTFDRNDIILYTPFEQIISYDEATNLKEFGKVFFGYYSECFLLAGIILLISALGPICLTATYKRFKNV